MANLVAKNYDSAIEWANKSLHLNPAYSESHLIRAAALGHLGRKVEAESSLRNCVETDVGFLPNWAAGRPYIQREKLAHCLDGLRKAGWEG